MPSKKAAPAPEPQDKLKQTDLPRLSLADSEKIAIALVNEFGGREASPPDVALAAGISPTSSSWRVLTGSSVAYGLTSGGHNAITIKLEDLGRRLIAPESEGEDLTARREAVLKPRICKQFFEKYQRAKFPSDAIAQNVLRSLGVPNDRLAEAAKLVRENGKYAGFIRDTPTGPFVTLDNPVVPVPAATNFPIAPEVPPDKDSAEQETLRSELPTNTSVSASAISKKVFISHGKQRGIVKQISELLSFGGFEPVISVERESTAIPVPEKVFEDMRACSAGVIHVGGEGTFLDSAGNSFTKLNDNVLIEIGAAIALYGKRLVLLVEKGVPLPSNLQGLYRCEYGGDQLDYDSTMKLLKTFNQFK